MKVTNLLKILLSLVWALGSCKEQVIVNQRSLENCQITDENCSRSPSSDVFSVSSTSLENSMWSQSTDDPNTFSFAISELNKTTEIRFDKPRGLSESALIQCPQAPSWVYIDNTNWAVLLKPKKSDSHSSPYHFKCKIVDEKFESNTLSFIITLLKERSSGGKTLSVDSMSESTSTETTSFNFIPSMRWEKASDFPYRWNYGNQVDKVVIDSNDNFYVLGTAEWPSIKKFNASGVEITEGWDKYSKSLFSDGYARDIHISPDDTLLVQGWERTVVDGTSYYKQVIKKFSQDGTEVEGWKISIDTGTSNSTPKIIVDHQGDIYMGLGGKNLVNASSDNDWWIKKFLSDGTEVTSGWDKKFDVDNGSYDVISVFALDNSNNLTVAGGCNNGNYRWCVRKFAPDGTYTSSWTLTTEEKMSIYDIAFDASGKFYVLGSGYHLVAGNTGHDYWFRRFNTDLTEDVAFEKTFHFQNSSDRGFKIHFDNDGNIYTVGSAGVSWNIDGHTYPTSYAWIKKYLPNGTEVTTGWNKVLYKPSTNTEGYASRSNAFLGFRNDGNILAVGEAHDVVSSDSSTDWYIKVFNSSGAEVLDKSFDFDIDASEEILDGRIDNQGNLHLIGTLEKSNDEIFVWYRVYDSNGNYDPAKEQLIDTTNIYITGLQLNQQNDIYLLTQQGNLGSDVSLHVRKFHSSDGSEDLSFATITGTSNNFKSISNMYVDDEDNLFISYYDYGSSSACLARIDATGGVNSDWSKCSSYSSDPVVSQDMYLVKGPSGNYYSYHYEYDNNTSEDSIKLVKYDSNHNVITAGWEKPVATSDYFMALRSTDHSIRLVTRNVTDKEIKFREYSFDGSLISDLTIPFTDAFFLKGAEFYENHLLAYGHTDVSGSTKFWIKKIDLDTGTIDQDSSLDYTLGTTDSSVASFVRTGNNNQFYWFGTTNNALNYNSRKDFWIRHYDLLEVAVDN